MKLTRNDSSKLDLSEFKKNDQIVEKQVKDVVPVDTKAQAKKRYLSLIWLSSLVKNFALI